MGIYQKYIHTYLFASEFMAHETEKFWGKGSFRWDMLRNPFDSKMFSYSPDYDDYGLYFGRLVDEKGVDVLVQAAAYTPEVNLKIVGDGPDESKLKDIVDKYGLKNVEFVGPRWGDSLNQLLKRTRFVVVPSVWHENFPYVINQSFAYGKPVIGARRGGIPEMVAHGERGLVYPAQESDSLAKAMRRLWNDPATTVEMGRKAKEFSDLEFNDTRQYERLMQIYEKVLV
jgi:glycosyltransferase involved in cell wall biosynthesis